MLNGDRLGTMEEAMNYNMTHGVWGQLARIGRRAAAIVAECNYAQAQVTSLRDTPARF
jgi:hypothetical protein